MNKTFLLLSILAILTIAVSVVFFVDIPSPSKLIKEEFNIEIK